MVAYRNIPGRPGYRVGDDASVWTCRARGRKPALTAHWRRLTQRLNKDGYYEVYLAVPKPGRIRVHRLVLEAFVGPRPEGMEACHKDGDRTNNRPDNLRWGTPAGNWADRVAHGTDNVGERNGRARLTPVEVRLMRSRRAAGATYGQLALEFNVNRNTARSACAGITWQSVA